MVTFLYGQRIIGKGIAGVKGKIFRWFTQDIQFMGFFAGHRFYLIFWNIYFTDISCFQ